MFGFGKDLRDRATLVSVESTVSDRRPALARAWLWSWTIRDSDEDENVPAVHAEIADGWTSASRRAPAAAARASRRRLGGRRGRAARVDSVTG